MSAPISPRGPRPPPLPSGSSSATLLQNGRGVIRTPSSEKVNGVRPLEMAPSFASAATNIAIEAIEDVKQQWIASQMKAKAQAYSADGALSVRVGTWNVNGKACTESLTDWLGGVQNSADVLALGFQELDTSTEAYLYYDQAKEDYWSTLIEKALGERKDHYYKVGSKQLVGILLMVYAKVDHRNKITEVATSSAGCGIMGMMGNKGAVAVRFKYENSKLCFINSHLAAESSQVERRNQDYHEITKRLSFPPLKPQLGETVSTLQHPVAIWDHEPLLFDEPIEYQKAYDDFITLKNKGTVMAQWKFVAKMDEKVLCKPWLFVSPNAGLLMPGEEVRIAFSIYVDNSTVGPLNAGGDKIEDIIVLHLENGKDYFLTVEGKWLPTVFGMPLERLCTLLEPIRAPKQELGQLSIPKELWRLVDHIFTHGMQTPSLFLVSGDSDLIEQTRVCLDTGEAFGQALFTEIGIHSVCETITRLLAALPEPVVPYAYYNKCLNACDQYQAARAAAQSLPTAHYNVFVYITSFLREVIHPPKQRQEQGRTDHPRNEEEENGDAAGIHMEKLALIFASLILRDRERIPLDSEVTHTINQRKAAFLMHFLKIKTKSSDTPLTIASS